MEELNEFGDPIVASPAKPSRQDTGVNEFGDTIVPFRPQPTVKDSIVQGSTVNPDDAAKGVKLAPKLNVPASVIEKDPKKYEEAANRQDAISVTQSNDFINGWVADNPGYAKLAMDDFKPLGDLMEQFANFPSKYWAEVQKQYSAKLDSYQHMPSKYTGAMLDLTHPDFNEVVENMKKQGVDEYTANRIGAKLQRNKEIQGTAFDAAMVALGPAGAAIAVLWPAFQAATTVAVSEPIEKATGFPKELTDQILLAALTGKGLYSYYKYGQVGAPVTAPHMKSSGEDLGNFVDTANLYTSRGKTTWQEIQEFLNPEGKAPGKPEVKPQLLLEGPKPEIDLTKEAAKAEQAVDAKTPETERPPEEVKPGEEPTEGPKPVVPGGPPVEVAEEPAAKPVGPYEKPIVPPAGEVARLSLKENEVPRVGDDFTSDRVHTFEHAKDLTAFDEQFRRVQDLKLKERSPEALEDLLSRALPDSNIYIPADTIAMLYHESEPRPNDKILGWADRAEQRVVQALTTHTDMAVPQAQALAYMEKPVYDKIKDQIKFKANGVSQEDADLIEQKGVMDYDRPLYELDKDFVDFLKTNAPDFLQAPEVPPTVHAELSPEHIADIEAVAPSEMARVKAAAGINRKGVVSILGASRYGDLTELHKIVVKELFQNSKDTVERALATGLITQGKIEIQVDKQQNLTRIIDNGMGMSAEVLGGPFLSIATSAEKEGTGSGGFGIAKMVTIYTAKKVKVQTLRDGKFSVLETTGKEIQESAETGNPLPDNALISDVPTADELKLFPEGHGTIVEIVTPSHWTDPSDNTQREINFADYRGSHDALRGSPLFANIEVKFTDVGGMNASLREGDDKETALKVFSETMKIGSNFPAEDFVPVFTARFGWGTATLIRSAEPVPENKQWDEFIGMRNLQVLSRGLWQFGLNIPANPSDPWGAKIPYHFYLNVDPKVEPREVGYPFQLDRQGWTRTAQDDAAKIINFLSTIYQQQEFATATKQMGTISYLTPEGATKAEPLEPKAEASDTPFTMFTKFNKVEVVPAKGDKPSKLLVDGKEIPDFTSAQLDKKLNVDELTIDDSLIDKTRPLLHSNMVVDKALVDKRLGGSVQALESHLSIDKLQKARDALNNKLNTQGLEEDEFNQLIEMDMKLLELKAQLKKRMEAEKDPKLAKLEFDAQTARLKLTKAELSGDDAAILKARLRANDAEDKLSDYQRVEVIAPKVDVVEYGRQLFGKRFDDFNYYISNMFMELRDAMSEVLGDPNMKDWAIGISYDITYRGVSTIIPFRAAYLNPAGPEFTDPARAAVGMWQTANHELAHNYVRSHKAEFTAQQQRQLLQLEALELQMLEGTTKVGYSPFTVKRNLYEFFRANEDILRYVTEAIRSDAEPIGRRFKDPDAQETGGNGGLAPGPSRRGIPELAAALEGIEEPGVPGVGEKERPAEPGGAEGAEFSTPGKPETELSRAAKREAKALYIGPLFKEPLPGMDKVAFGRYSKRIEGQDEATREKAIENGKKLVRKQATTEWKQKRDEVKVEVERDLKRSPAIAADRFLRLGETPTGEKLPVVRLDSAAVKALGGKGLERYSQDKNGAAPDDVALVAGMKTGQELIETLNKFEADRKKFGKGSNAYLAHLINQETDRRMQMRHGTLQADILSRARDLVTDYDHMEILTDELQALAKEAGLPFDKEQIKNDVKRRFKDAVAQDVSYEMFRRGAWKAFQVAEKHLLAGKYKEAFHAAQNRARAILFAKEAKSFDGKMDSAERNFRKIVNNDKRGGVDQAYYDNARKILGDIGFAPFEGQEPEKTLSELIAENQGGLAVAPWLFDLGQRRPNMSYKNLTVGEFEALDKSIRSLLKSGREAKTVDSVHGRANLDNVLVDIETSMSRFPVRPLIGWKQMGVTRRMRSLGKKALASLVLVERIFDYTDKFDPNGPLSTYIDRPLREAFNKELVLTEKVVKQLQSLEKYVDNSINDFINNTAIKDTNDGANHSMTRQNMRYVMLHMGSESGLMKAARGYNVDPIELYLMVKNNATAADIAWVNGMHKLFDSLWTEASEMQRRYTGIEPDSIEARPWKVTLKDGKEHELTGGYSPVFYDKNRSNIEGDLMMKGDLFDSTYVASIPAHSYTLPRTQYFGWIDMNGSLMKSKIQQMVHDIAFREPVREVQRLISTEKFHQIMVRHWGEEYANLIKPWLKNIANIQNVDDAFAQDLAYGVYLLRRGVTNTLVAFNPGTYMKHGMSALAMSIAQRGTKGFSKELVKLGVPAMLEAARDLIFMRKGEMPDADFMDALKEVNNVPSSREFILKSSPLFRTRAQFYKQTIRGAYERASEAGVGHIMSNISEWGVSVGRVPVAFSDQISAMPVWLAAYKNALRESGDHDEAVYQADRITARAHGSNFLGDKPALMRAGGVGFGGQVTAITLTLLYNFWNHELNNLVQLAWDIGQRGRGKKAGTEEGEPGAHIGDIAKRMFLLVFLMIAIEEMASPHYGEDRRSLGQKALLATVRFFGGLWPGFREITNAAAHGYEPSVGGLGYIYTLVNNLIKDAAAGGRNQWIQHAFTFLGMFGVPFTGAQAGRTVQGEVRRLQGRENPKGWQDWTTLYRLGRIPRGPPRH